MKQFIKYMAIIASVFILAACGSNSKENPGSSASTTIPSGGLTTDDQITDSTSSGSNDVAVNLGYELKNATAFVSVTEAVTPYELKVQVVQNGFVVPGKTFNLKAFDTKYGSVDSMSSTTDAQGFVIFTFTSIEALSTLYGSAVTLEAILSESENNATIELTQKFVLSFKAKSEDVNDTIPDENTYVLKNATTPLTITNPETQYELKVQLVLNEFAVAGQTLTLKAFDNPNDKFGIFASMSATTDALGYVTFNYSSPKNIDDLGSLTLSAVLDSEQVLMQTFVLNFDKDEAEPEPEVDLPIVVIPESSKNITLTNNGQQEVINVKVFQSKAPYSEGNVKVALDYETIVNGIDVGSFENYSVPIVNGIATFNYTGPQNINDGQTGTSFEFYHESNSEGKKSVEVSYSPTSNEYIPINYTLNITSEDGEFTMPIPNKEKTFSVILKDDKGDNVDESNILSMSVETQNNYIAKLLDNGEEVSSFIRVGENPVTFVVRTNKKSGLIPIKVEAIIQDPNDANKTRTYSKTVNIIVQSGPPTAMSISYVGVTHDAERAKYVERYAITATDAYNNKVNTAPSISTGAIVGYAIDGSTPPDTTPVSQQKRIYYAKGEANATITPTVTGDEALFKITAQEDEQEGFAHIDEANDKLVIFGEGYIYEALGKWDFEKLSNTELLLKDNYFGAYRENLYYAIGHNYRQDPCRSDGTEYVGFASVVGDKAVLDEEGTAIVEVKYDYHLTGKDIMLWINLVGYQADTDQITRIGESKNISLRGAGLISQPSGVTLKKGSRNYATFDIRHEAVAESYRNAYFSVSTGDGSSCSSFVVDSTYGEYLVSYKDTEDNLTKKALYSSLVPKPSASNIYSSELVSYRDSRECKNFGAGYITFVLSATADEGCSHSIDNIEVVSEF